MKQEDRPAREVVPVIANAETTPEPEPVADGTPGVARTSGTITEDGLTEALRAIWPITSASPAGTAARIFALAAAYEPAGARPAVPGRDAIAALLGKWLGTPDWEALNVADKIIALAGGGSDGD